MRAQDVEKLIRDHYRREVFRAHHSVSAGAQVRRPPVLGATQNRSGFQYIAAAAALVALPVLLLVSRPAAGPLAGIIDEVWRSGGRASVTSVLLEARDRLLIQPRGAMPPVEDEEE